MFDRSCKNVASASCRSLRDPKNGGIVRFGAAGRENDLIRSGIERFGDLATRRIDAFAGRRTYGMQGGWVAIAVSEIGQHRFKDRGFNGGRGGVVQVDRK